MSELVREESPPGRQLGGTKRPPSGFPVERELVQPFVLPDEQGRRVDLEDFRGTRNLVLLFVEEATPEAESLLHDLAAVSGALAAEEAAVLPVVHGTKREAAALRERLRLPFPVLYDEEGNLVRSFCGGDASIYVTDRFREIFAARNGGELFSRDEILERLAHVNRQCPECGVAEWPM